MGRVVAKAKKLEEWEHVVSRVQQKQRTNVQNRPNNMGIENKKNNPYAKPTSNKGFKCGELGHGSSDCCS